jgi:hypothetical protein
MEVAGFVLVSPGDRVVHGEAGIVKRALRI